MGIFEDVCMYDYETQNHHDSSHTQIKENQWLL